MPDTISPSYRSLLRALVTAETPLSRAELAAAAGITRISAIRALDVLVEQGYATAIGNARARRYEATDAARVVVLWNATDYLAQEPDQRQARYTHIEPRLFRNVQGAVSTPPAAVVAAMERRRNADPVTARKELERFVIELSWKSSKIEGNTYTLLDTERLIREADEAQGHAHAEAVMILNHKRAFNYVWDHQADFRQMNRSDIGALHQLLVADLDVPTGLRTTPVGITGTVYVPPASQVEVASYLDDVIQIINALLNPLDKALACLVLLPYLQPFADGNKRTSRLLGNGVLLAYGYPPLSYRSVNEQDYKGALILFYEQGTLANFRELFMQQLVEAATGYSFPTGMAIV